MTIVDKLVPPRGLRVLVSGGAAGIGAAIATGFVAAGAKVQVCDASPSAVAAFQDANPDCVATLADVASPGQVEAVFDIQSRRIGGLDVLVNNAGIAGPTSGIADIAEDDWNRTIDVNLNAQFRFIRHGLPLLRSSPSANIICISSIAGRLGYAWRTPYAASKWAIIGLVKSLAAELGPEDIRVNAVLPGVVDGPRIQEVIKARAAQLGVPVEEMEKSYRSKASLQRMVTADDIAATVLFLCSPAARNISGQAISVDGNVEAL